MKLLTTVNGSMAVAPLHSRCQHGLKAQEVSESVRCWVGLLCDGDVGKGSLNTRRVVEEDRLPISLHEEQSVGQQPSERVEIGGLSTLEERGDDWCADSGPEFTARTSSQFQIIVDISMGLTMMGRFAFG